MKELNYETIKNKIDTYYKEKLILENKIENDVEKKMILFNVFGNLNQDLEIKDLYILELIGNINILKYTTVNNEKNNRVETIVFVKDDNPIFKVEHHEQKNKDTVYCDTCYTVYEENSCYLMNKLHTTTLTNDNFSTSEVTIINRVDPNIREYYQKKYKFYQRDSKVIALKTKNKMYIEMDAGYENILLTAEKLINGISSKVIKNLENIILGDQVKEYKISRRVKK